MKFKIIIRPILVVILTSIFTTSSHAQFTCFSAADIGGSPDCATLRSGTEVFGGIGTPDIATCVVGNKTIYDYSLVPYGPGWFGDTEGLLYFYDGANWNLTGNTSCGTASGITWTGGGDPQDWSDVSNWVEWLPKVFDFAPIDFSFFCLV